MAQRYGINDLITAKFQVSSASILAMFGAAVPVIPAPGLSKGIIIEQILVQTNPGTINYAAGGVVNLQYHGGSAVHAGTIAAAVLISGTQTFNLLAGISAGLQVPVNTGVDITNITGAFTTGNGTLTVTIWYYVEKLPA